MVYGNAGLRAYPLTIAIDGNFLAMPHTGIGTYLRGLVDALQADAGMLGVSAHLITPSDGRLLHPGGKAHRFAWDSAGITGRLLRMPGRRPSLLHLPQMSAPLWSPVPLVVTIHDVIPFVLEDYRASRAMDLYLKIMARTVRQARRIIVPSEAAQADVVKVLGANPDLIRVIPEAASKDLVPSRNGDAAGRVHERWGLNGPYVFNIGGFDRRKNLPLLIDAFAAALPALPEQAMLVIAGSPHSDNARIFPPLEPLIRKHGLGDKVLLTGPVSHDERRWLYQAAHAYVTPSIYEGFGLTPLEAMACGVPAIVANRTSLPEVVSDAGLVVDPETGAFAEAIRELMTNDDLWRRLSAASLTRSATFTWASTARQTAEVYHHVARHSSTSLPPVPA